jgi:hypothetical protein
MARLDRRASGGDSYSLHPFGWGRYLDLVVLSVWLTFWVVGETVALALAGGLVAAVVTAPFGVTLSHASRIAPDGSAPFFLLFILLWLTIWTVGGVAALTHVLRSVAGEDLVAVSSEGLAIVRRAGPFRRRRTIPLDAIRRVRLHLTDAAVVADTTQGVIDVTRLGTRDDRRDLLAWLQRRLVLPDEAEAQRRESEAPPHGWEVQIDGVETRLSRITQRARRNSAIVLWSAAAMIATGLVSGAQTGRMTNVHVASGVVSTLVALWAAWATWGRSEWLVSHGRLVWRRQFATWEHERPFADGSLELVHHVDSDGDDRYTLRVRDARDRRTIATGLHDPSELTSLAHWLAKRTRFPFDRSAA